MAVQQLIKWPTSGDYNTAVQNPKVNFADPAIKLAKPELTNLGLPKARAGAFATVYRMQASSGDFAIRCFSKNFDDLQDRYAAISSQLKVSKLPYTVGFDFIDKGILVNGNWYPILRMDWVKGELLNKYIEKNLHNRNKLLSLARQLVEMIRCMHNERIAHGDLQNGNILVSNDKLILVDYDGMYVPALQGKPSHELGQRNFQHPSRRDIDFGPEMDNFSAWVIYISILALASDPTLWTTTGAAKSDEQLLFRREDFDLSNISPTLRMLEKNANPSVQALASCFEWILSSGIDQIPILDEQKTETIVSSIPQLKSGIPVWMQDHRQTSNIVELPLQKQIDHEQGLSSWLFDTIAASETLAMRQFSSSFFAPRFSMTLSAVIIAIVIIMSACNPSLTLETALSIAALVVTNLIVLLVNYNKDHVIKEARVLIAEEKKHCLELREIKKVLQSVEHKKASLEKQHKKAISNFDQLRSKLKITEQGELANETKSCTSQLANLNERRNKLSRSEDQEIKTLWAGNIGVRIKNIDVEVQTLDRDETSELSIALSTIQKKHIESYLQNQPLTSSSVSGIGPKLAARLHAKGFRTAFEVRYWAVQSVEGIGKAKAGWLISWAQRCEASARKTMPMSLSPSTTSTIKSKYSSKRSTLQAEKYKLQPQIKGDEEKIRSLYKQDMVVLAQEQTTIEETSKQKVSGIRQCYITEYSKIDEQIIQAGQALKQELNKIELDIKQAQKQIFSANMRVAKSKHRLTPYSKLNFIQYVKTAIFSPRAA